MKAELSKWFEFDAAHHLLHVSAGHKCSAPHGHHYRVQVVVEGEVDAAVGWVMDFARIKQAVEPLIAQMDHHDLNELPGLANTTSELIAKWLWDRIAPQLSQLKSISIAESDSSLCTYRGQ